MTIRGTLQSTHLIHDDDFTFGDQRASDTQQLALADGEIRAILTNGIFQRSDAARQFRSFDGSPEGRIYEQSNT